MNSAVRVLILTPTALPCLTGNAVTAERWRRALAQQGAVVHVTETQGLTAGGLIGVLERFRPQVVHAHHISRAGALMLDPPLLERYGALPLVVSPGGTDINLHAGSGEGRAVVDGVCRRAHAIVVQSPEMARLAGALMPDLKERIAMTPKSFLWLGEEPFDLRAASGCREGDILFFMPAGVRPVKGNLECLQAMEKAHQVCPSIRVVFSGPILHVGYAERFEAEIRRLGSFADWIGAIPPQAMHAAYGGADVVLNHSASEGLSNALLEAMAAGRPVLASDIPGNRWLITDAHGNGPCGCLFDPCDGNDFMEKTLRLAGDAALRESLASNGRRKALTWPQPSDEAGALLNIYRAIIARCN